MRLGLKLTHKRITTKVVLPVSRVRVLYRGNYKCVKKGSYDVKLLKSSKVRGKESGTRGGRCISLFFMLFFVFYLVFLCFFFVFYFFVFFVFFVFFCFFCFFKILLLP